MTIKEKNTAFIDFIREDKSKYKTATEAGFYDPDNDFLVGDSGGFLFNINFKFINTNEFSEVATHFEEHGTYIKASIDTPNYDKFRIREEKRRKVGLVRKCKLLPDGTITDLRITGDHYNFLNYSRMFKLDDESIVEGKTFADKKEGFPVFFDSQYWYFKTREFARNNGFNLCISKTRRGGLSYTEGANSANVANLTPNVTVIHTAYDKTYLTKANAITRMTKRCLDWYEFNTPFCRGGRNSRGEFNGLLVKDLEKLELGYKLPDGTKAGYLSFIPSLSFGPSNPDVAIGKDAVEIKVEEMNNAPNLEAFMRVTAPTTRTGAYTTGMVIGWGTAGSKEGNWQEFERWFYNPAIYNGLPLENVWDKDSRHTVCGFFKPYWWGLQGQTIDGRKAMDLWGNTDWVVADEIVTKERAHEKENTSTADYLAYCGQYANFPAESFSNSVENMFTSIELDDKINSLRFNLETQFHRDGMFSRNEEGQVVFRSNAELESNGTKVHPFVEHVPFREGDDLHGCFRMWHPPWKDANGKIPDGLYRIYDDPVGIDKDKKEITTKHSLHSFLVYMTSNNIANSIGDIFVGAYCGRTNSMEEDNRILLAAADYYNAKVLAEVNRGQVVQDFKKWKRLDRLVKEPTYAWDNKLIGTGGKSYGVTIAGDKRINGLTYIKDHIYKVRSVDAEGNTVLNLHYINYLQLLLELQKWNNTGNFDRVSSYIIAMYDIMEMGVLGTKPKEGNTQPPRNSFRDRLQKGQMFN